MSVCSDRLASGRWWVLPMRRRFAGGQNVMPAIPFGLGVAGAGRLEFCTLLFTVMAARREAATAMAAGRVASVEEKLEPVVVAADAWGRW